MKHLFVCPNRTNVALCRTQCSQIRSRNRFTQLRAKINWLHGERTIEAKIVHLCLKWSNQTVSIGLDLCACIQIVVIRIDLIKCTHSNCILCDKDGNVPLFLIISTLQKKKSYDVDAQGLSIPYSDSNHMCGVCMCVCDNFPKESKIFSIY